MKASSRQRWCSLLGDPVRRARLGAAARALVEANRGAKDKTMAVLEALLPPSRAPSRPTSSRSDPLLDSLYGAIGARRARRWYERHPDRRRHLRAAGHQRRQPLDGRHRQDARGRRASPHGWSSSGERPAILSRGYGAAATVRRRRRGLRRHEPPGDARPAGDEPLMLARAVPGAIVCVCAGSLPGGRARRAHARRDRAPARRWVSAFPAGARSGRAGHDASARFRTAACCRSAGCASRRTPPRARTCWS